MRRGCRRRSLLWRRLAGSLGGPRLFLRLVMADRAADGGPSHRMVPGHVAGDTTNRGARHATSSRVQRGRRKRHTE
jgi:hypothetical protein